MFSFGERLGMLFLIMGGCLSAFSASLVLVPVMLRWLRRTASTSRHRIDASDNIIFLNLMLLHFIQALGELPIIKWKADGVVTEGPLCTAQGVIKHVGGDGLALSSLAISVFTFCVLGLRRSAPKYTPKLAVAMIWTALSFIIAIPAIRVVHMKEQYYGNVGYWCWVRTEFKTEQLVTFDLCLWVALLFMIISYTIMFVMMRGWFIVDNGVWYWYSNNIHRHGMGLPAEETPEEKDSKVIANLLWLYPAVYFVCTIPYSIARWRFYSGLEDPYQFAFFGATLYTLSGTFNALLFFFTPGRPNLVVGSADPPAVEIQIQPFHDQDPSSWEIVTPLSRSPIVSDNVTPNFERDSRGQSDPYESVPLAEGTNGNIRPSPRRIVSDPGSDATYLSGELSHGEFSFNPTLPPVEEESY